MNTPADVAGLKPNSSLRQQFVNLAVTLDNYNNGLIGPGHCSEESAVAPVASTTPTTTAPVAEIQEVPKPTSYVLQANYPNPFNPATISCSPSPSRAS